MPSITGRNIRSTEMTVWMIVLPPFPPRRAWLKSFGLVMSLLCGLLVCVLSPLMSKGLFATGLLLVLALAALSLLRPAALSMLYRLWNRAAYDFARCARLLLTAVCFYVVLVAAGRAGSSLQLALPGRSLWEPVRDQGVNSGAKIEMMAPSRKGWIARFVTGAKESGNVWMFCLLPFFALLGILEIKQETDDLPELPVHTYTLF